MQATIPLNRRHHDIPESFTIIMVVTLAASLLVVLMLITPFISVTQAHSFTIESTLPDSALPTLQAASSSPTDTLHWDTSPSLPADSPILNPATFIPPTPNFPLRFRAKCRFLTGKPPALEDGAELSVYERAAHSMAFKPSLLLVHFDGVSMKIREDFYTLRKSIHRRYFTSIKHFNSESEWLIYHKQPKSPRACFSIPFSHTFSALFAAPGTPRMERTMFARLHQLGRELDYQGLATLQLLQETGEQTGRNMTVLHYKVRNEIEYIREAKGPEHGPAAHAKRPVLQSDAPPMHLYLHPLTHQPLVISTPSVRLDILSFQVVTDEDQIHKMQGVFDPKKASKAECVPFTSHLEQVPTGERARQQMEQEGHDEL